MGNLDRVRHTDDLQWVNSRRQRLADSRHGEGLFIPGSSCFSPIVLGASERLCAIRIALADVSSVQSFQTICLTGRLPRLGAHLLALPFRCGGQYCRLKRFSNQLAHQTALLHASSW
ncbi:MAG: hypothetical protein V7641_5577 [Blastocatellia bacterium]